MVQPPGDAHGCPACPHPTLGPAILGSPNVNINGRPAVRVQDIGIHSPCCGQNMWTAMQGAPHVFVNGKAAYRMADPAQSCGGSMKLVEGSTNVIVGDLGGGGGGGGSGGRVQFASGSTSPSSGQTSQGETSEGSGEDPGPWAAAGAPGRVASQAAEEAREEEKAWIEVEVVDQDGIPWDASEYKLELPDFSLQEGQLDDKGRVRREQIIPGLARLWLPDPDAHDFAHGGAQPANEEKAWLEVELTDDGGLPLAGRKVKIELPDGTLIDDTLDENGRLRRDDIVAGTAKLHLVEEPPLPVPVPVPVPVPDPERKSWLEVQLTDDSGAPLAGAPVKLELPDGTIIDETLDAEGRLVRKDLRAGTAKLHLVDEPPGSGTGTGTGTGTGGPEPKAWLEVQLTDDSGAPLAGAPVKLELPDGTLIDEKLDDEGRLVRKDLRAGTAKLHLVEEPPLPRSGTGTGTGTGTGGTERKAWLEVQLTDDAGAPLAGLPVKLELADGTMIDEKLDDQGRLVRRDIPAGTARLHLPED